MRRPGRRRRWGELSGVERVGLYTRQSLYLVLVGFALWFALPAAFDAEVHGQAYGLLVGAVVVTVAGVVALQALLRSIPAGEPVAWRRVAPLPVVAGAFFLVAVTAWAGDVRIAAVTVAAAGVLLSFGLLPGRRVLCGLLALSGLLFLIAGGEPTDALAGLLFAAAFLVTSRASMWILQIVMDLDVARHVQARLAVAEERLRFSRDVHDVLGRRLSTIAVQAELAATLAQRGDERAVERMLEVRAVAHDALREARELARGYRPTDFPNELDGARSLLRSAGIAVELDVEAVPRAWHEAAGWVVRESVTNVLRHSDASVVGISYAGGHLRVENDGAHAAGGPSDGTGLRGLRERLAPLGASLAAEPDGAGRWVVLAELPQSGPLSATREGGLRA